MLKFQHVSTDIILMFNFRRIYVTFRGFRDHWKYFINICFNEKGMYIFEHLIKSRVNVRLQSIVVIYHLTMTTFQEKICFNFLLIALNVFDTSHIVFAILDVVRSNHEKFYPEALLAIFPYFHYPLYR